MMNSYLENNDLLDTFQFRLAGVMTIDAAYASVNDPFYALLDSKYPSTAARAPAWCSEVDARRDALGADLVSVQMVSDLQAHPNDPGGVSWQFYLDDPRPEWG